jgi:hypothetical protein
MSDLHGSPGLWKFSKARAAVPFDREFHLPLSVLKTCDLFDSDLEQRDLTRECVDWAIATLHGNLPAAWSAPAADHLEAAIPPNGLTVQTGPIIRQGSLVCTAERLALVFPILREVPAELPPRRQQLLSELAIDAQNRWRMVRIGWNDTSDRRGIEAEVDLTGAPHPVLQQLVRVGVDALGWVVQWIVTSAALLADVRVDCRAWQCCASGQNPRKGDVSSC